MINDQYKNVNRKPDGHSIHISTVAEIFDEKYQEIHFHNGQDILPYGS